MIWSVVKRSDPKRHPSFLGNEGAAPAPASWIPREGLITACIKEFYLVPEQPSLAAQLQEVRRRSAEQQLPAPNYRTLVRRVEELDPRYAMAKRKGSKAAGEKFGPIGPTLRPDSPSVIRELLIVSQTRLFREQQEPGGVDSNQLILLGHRPIHPVRLAENAEFCASGDSKESEPYEAPLFFQQLASQTPGFLPLSYCVRQDQDCLRFWA